MLQNAEKLIARAKIQFLTGKKEENKKGWPFLGTMTLGLRVREGSSIGCRRMGTDGKNLFYNKEYTERLTEAERLGVLCHEVCHVLLQHVLEWRRPSTKEFPEIFTMAQEYVVNDMVVNMFGLTLPGGVYYDKAFSGMYTEQVYHELLKRLKPQKSTSFADKLAERMVDQHGLGAPKQGPNGSAPDTMEAWSGTKALEQLGKEIRLRAAQAASSSRIRGTLPLGLEQIIGEVLEPQVNWRVALAEFLCGTSRDDFSWKSPNRRHLHRGIILPALKSESIEIALIFDTSGSITVEQLTEAYSEARGIMSAFPSYTLYLIGCDAEVHSLQVIEPHDEPDLKELFKGRGGTSFCAPFIRLQEKEIQPRAAVYFTADADGSFPDEEPDYPVLWVIKEGAREVPFGRAVMLD